MRLQRARTDRLSCNRQVRGWPPAEQSAGRRRRSRGASWARGWPTHGPALRAYFGKRAPAWRR